MFLIFAAWRARSTDRHFEVENALRDRCAASAATRYRWSARMLLAEAQVGQCVAEAEKLFTGFHRRPDREFFRRN
jgi:hypothetical protein